jgi:antitoxin (DNA-binding transcriptional repressor) of toxin-antitoxin stability system
MPSYSVSEARNQLPKLLDQALAGEEVTITRRGKTVVKMVAQVPCGMTIDLEWLDRVRVKPKDPNFDSAELVRQMRDESRY